MRILQVSLSGGVGRSYMGPVTNDIFQLTREFALQGHTVTVADCRALDERARFPAGAGLLEVDTPSPYEAFHAGAGALQRALARARSAMLNDLEATGALGDHDVVHVHDAALAVVLSRRPGSRCCFTCHTPNWLDPERYRGMRGRLRRMRLRWTTLQGKHDLAAMRAARIAIVLHPAMLDALAELKPDVSWSRRVRVVPNGIDLTAWPPPDRTAARVALGSPPGKLRIICVTRADPRKGLHTLIDALGQVVPSAPDVQVDVVGHVDEGDYAQRLRSAAASLPVSFHGFISNQDPRFRQLLAAADLCVVPSLVDNQPNVVMESLIMGVPVLGSRVGGIPMMVPPEVGRIFEPGDAAGLASAIHALYWNRDVLRTMQSRCRTHVEQRYSWAESARRHVEVFSEPDPVSGIADSTAAG